MFTFCPGAIVNASPVRGVNLMPPTVNGRKSLDGPSASALENAISCESRKPLVGGAGMMTSREALYAVFVTWFARTKSILYLPGARPNHPSYPNRLFV